MNKSGGIEVLIATPGRLNDLLEMRVVDLTQVCFLGKNYTHFLIGLFVLICISLTYFLF